MKQDLDGRRIVLTGASSGIGRAAALMLAARGARLALVARRAEELDKLAAEIVAAGGEAHCFPANLADTAAIEELAAALLKHYGTVDVLINNAAHSIRRPIEESFDRLHDFQRTIQLNYLAAVQLSLQLLPAMIEQGDGHIVNVSTWGTLVPSPKFAAYIGSKSALDGFSSAIGAELSSRGIAVTTVHFPLVHTPMSAPTRHYAKMPGLTPDQAAVWLLKAVRQRPPRVAPGLLVLSGANSLLFPKMARNIAGRLGF